MKLLSITILVFSFILFTSCASFKPFSNNPESVSKEIGPEGGIITTPDGRLTLSIPAGALGNTEIITIEELNPNDLPEEYRNMKAVYEFGPDGLAFSRLVAVSYSGVYGSSPVSGNTLEMPVAVMGVVSENQSESEILENIEIQHGQRPGVFQIEGKLNHFSHVVIWYNDDFRVSTDIEKTELYVGEATTVSSLLKHKSGTRLQDDDSNFIIQRDYPFLGMELFSDYEFSEVRYTDQTIENGIRLQPFEPPIVDSPYQHYKLNDFPVERYSEFLTKEMNNEKKLYSLNDRYGPYDYYVNTFIYTCIEAGSPGTEPLRGKVDLEFYHPAFESSRIITLFFGDNPESTITVQCLSEDEEEEDTPSLLSEMEPTLAIYSDNPVGTLEGQVTVDGRGIQGVEVRVEFENGSFTTQRTDASGNYRFENVLPGNPTVSIPLDTCEKNPREVEVKAFETAQADFKCDLEEETENGSTSNNFNLSVVKTGTGSGTVTGYEAIMEYRDLEELDRDNARYDIQCGAAEGCNSNFPENSIVELYAKPDHDSFFVGWSDNCREGTQNLFCTVTMNSNETVTATFSKKENQNESENAVRGNEPVNSDIQPDFDQRSFQNPEVGIDVGLSYRPSLGDYVEDQENLSESDTDRITPIITVIGKFDVLKDFSLPGFKKDDFTLSIGTSISRSKAGFTQTFTPSQGQTYVADGELIVTNWNIFTDLRFAENVLKETNRQMSLNASLRFGFGNTFNNISIRYRDSETDEEMEENSNHQSLTFFGGIGADVNLNNNWAVSPFLGYMSGKADSNWQGTIGVRYKF